MSDLQGGNFRPVMPLVVTDVASIPAEPPDEFVYRHKVKLVDSMRNLWNHREIIYTLAERDFRAQYKQATLGIMWALLSPVAHPRHHGRRLLSGEDLRDRGDPLRPLLLRRHHVLDLLRLLPRERGATRC